MSEVYEGRRARLRERFNGLEVDAALITSLVNVRYLTGFTGSNGAVLVTGDGAVFATDGRYATQSQSEVSGVDRMIERDRSLPEVLLERARSVGVRRLGFESHQLTVDQHRELTERSDGTELNSIKKAIEDLRIVKDDEEIASLREACAIGDRALAELVDGLVLGRTERQVAQELERRMIDHGADGLAFDTIVASGPNSAIPHHTPTSRRIEVGDFLTIDCGALFNGYHADMTRTFVVGQEPAAWQIEIYDLVFAAQKAGREALIPGTQLNAVDRAARSMIEAAGHSEHFLHGLGHGVGLETHEAPLFRHDAAGKLDARTPVTVEPGVYLPGKGGVRIEDTLVVLAPADGGPELLTMTTKELLVLD
jgi:Xaa-Pro aminopeptidase